MAGTSGVRIILNTRYFHIAKNGEKADGKHSLTKDAAGGLVEYIGTREGVSLNLTKETSSKPVTKKQENIIKELLDNNRDVKNLFEYQDYLKNPTIGNASEFITRACEMELGAIDLVHAVDTGKATNLIEYVGKRPGAVRVGEHGLFSSSNVDLKKAQQEIANCKGNIWSHVISIRREDADRLGYDTQKPWRDMVCSKIEMIAKEHSIPVSQLHWYGGMHNTGHHPHIHLIVFADDTCRPHLSQEGIKKMKGQFASIIFKDDLTQIYDQKTQYRNELRERAKNLLSEISASPQDQFTKAQIKSLAKKLLQIKEACGVNGGSCAYRYAKQDVKKLVDRFLTEMLQVPQLKKLYELYTQECLSIKGFYVSDPYNVKTILDNEEFKGLKTAVIKACNNLHLITEVTDESLGFVDSPLPLDLEREPEQDYSMTSFDIPSKENLDSLFNEEPPEILPIENPSIDLLNDFEPASKEKHTSTISELMQEAVDGKPTAQYQLAKKYFYGNGIERDYAQAQMWYGLAAEGGHSFAKYELGKMYLYGIGIEQDKELGKEYCLDAYYSFRFEIANKLGYDIGNEIDNFSLDEINFPKLEKQQGYLAYCLGRMQYAGEGVERDYEKAFKWFVLADYCGHIHSEYYIAKMYYNGQELTQDYAEALNWYKSAADKKDKYAYYALGKMYYNGIGTNQDYKIAADWFQCASKDDVSYVDYQLAGMFEKGLGIEANSETAQLYYKKALNEFLEQEKQQPDALVEYRIAKMYLSGKGCDINVQKGIEWMKTCVEKENHFAQFELAGLYLSNESISIDKEKANELYQKAFKGFIQIENDTPSTSLKYRIAQMYEKGLGTALNITEAFQWYLKAAENEHPHAMYIVGKYYFEDIGIQKDCGKAIEWYMKSAEYKNTYAMYALGKLYKNGIEVTQNFQKAFEYFHESASLGNSYSQLATAKMYLSGEGIAKDPHKAIHWLKECSKNLNPFADYQLGILYSSGKDIEKDETQAKKYFKNALSGFLTLEQEKSSESLEYRIAQMYEKGQGTDADLESALPWYRKAANSGNTYAAFRLGLHFEKEVSEPKQSYNYYKMALSGFLSLEQEKPSKSLEYRIAQMYEKGQGTNANLESALPWYIKASNNGNAYAALWLGTHYEKSNAVNSKQYYNKALQLFHSMEKENPTGEIESMLGYLYSSGKGCSVNKDASEQWYRLGMAHGNQQSKLGLSYLYIYSFDDSFHKKQAIQLLQELAEVKNATACSQLGKMYQYGIGVERSYEKSREWFTRAAEYGDKNADDYLENSEKQMTASAMGVIGRIVQLFASTANNNLMEHLNHQNHLDKKLRQREIKLKEALGQHDEMSMS